MLIDISLKITPEMTAMDEDNEKKAFAGYLGTHFDVIDKEFPLEYTERAGIIFDVSGVKEREISSQYIDRSKIAKNMFAAFYTGFIETERYGGKKYFTGHPVLSYELIEKLAERNIFVIENLCNLKSVLKDANSAAFTANTYPVNYLGMTDIPCRVIAEI